MRITLLSCTYHFDTFNFIRSAAPVFSLLNLQKPHRYFRRVVVANERKFPLNPHLRDARVGQGWSQEELAERIGTTSVNISRWENGSTFPSPHFRLQLCKIFDKTPAELGLLPSSPP